MCVFVIFLHRSAFNIDTLRCLVVLDEDTLWAFFEELSSTFGGVVKLKNLFALPEGERERRHHMLSIMVTLLLEPGITYGQLVGDAAVQATWRTHRAAPDGEPTARWHMIVDRAIAYMERPEMADVPVRLLAEVQILPNAYKQMRQQMHEVRPLCSPIFTICLPHFRSYEVVLLHMCGRPYKYPYAQGCDLS